jgi:hypothetical protein
MSAGMASRTVVSTAQVRAFTRRGRTGRWLDWYAGGFGALLAGIYLGDFLAAPFGRLAGRDVAALPPAQAETGLALVIAAAAGLLLLAQALGPLTLSPADASWLLMSPLDRRSVLRRPALAVMVLATLGGGLLGALAFALVGPYIRQVTRHTVGSWLAVAIVAGIGLGLAAALVSVLAQPAERARRRFRVAVLAVAGTAVAAGVVGARWASVPRAVTTGLAGLPSGIAQALAAAAVTVAAGCLGLAWRRLRSFPADVLWADSARAGRTRLAAAFLNVQLLTWIAEDNHWRRRIMTSRPWPRRLGRVAMGPAWVLAWADWRRLGRRPGTLVTLAASSAAPALAAGVITGSARGIVTAVALLIGGIAAASQGTAALRRDTNDATFRRLLGVAERPALIARAVLPALLSAGWLALALALLVSADGVTAPGTGGHEWAWPLAGFLAGPGLAAAALRIARTAPIDAADMRGVDLPTGAAPSWLLTRLLSLALGLIAGFPLLTVVSRGLGSAARTAIGGTAGGLGGVPQDGTAGGGTAGTLALQAVLSAIVIAGYLLAVTPGSGVRELTGIVMSIRG